MAHVDEVVAALWRIESPKIIARLARTLGDVGRAEELTQDAFVAALAQWPNEGVPRNPGAWLMTAAKRRAVDVVRRDATFERKVQELQLEIARAEAPETFASVYEDIHDDMLRLMFVACHPVLNKETRVTLTLRLLGGLTVAEIARAFLTSEATIAQRIVRGKRALAQAGVPFETPEPGERPQRLSSILEAIYLIFNEGYAATSGASVVRGELVEDGLRLGRVLCGLMPDEAEVFGLTSLMELQASRIPARIAPNGDQILLADQDRARWNRLLVNRGLTALARARELSGEPGGYALQAAIAACHARAARFEDTDWKQIASLYEALAVVLPTPVVELNRAIAVAMSEGPEAGLRIVDGLSDEPALRAYHLLPSVRGDLLVKLGREAEARAEFERAASLAQNERDREFLRRRAQACESAGSGA